MEWLTPVCSAIIVVATAIYGYLKRTHAERLRILEQQVEMYRDRCAIMEKEMAVLAHRLENVIKLEEICQEERRTLDRQRVELLMEIREIREESKQKRPRRGTE